MSVEVRLYTPLRVVPRPAETVWDVRALVEPAEAVDPHVRAVLLQEVRRLGEVPLLPPVAREVMALLQDPRAGMNQVAALVKKDPTMAAHLLRVANSAAYGGTTPASSLRAALVRLGADGVKRFLLSTAAARVLVVNGRPALGARLRTRSVAVSNASARIAAHYGTDVEAAFLAGLLHDVGWAVGHGALTRALPHLPPVWRAEPARGDGVIEALHEELGAVLATAWKLPPNAVDAIRSHHDPRSSSGGLMAYVVHAASRVCDALGIGPVEPHTDGVLEDESFMRLRIDAAAFDRIVAGLRVDLATP